MRTNDLISNLAENVTPVRRLPPFSRRFALFLFLGSALGTLTIGYFGFRRDLALVASTFFFQLQTVALASLFVLSTRLALLLSVPGERVSPLQQKVIWGSLVLSLSALVAASLPHFSEEALTHTLATSGNCIRYVGVVGLAYGIVFLSYLRKAAPLYPLQTGALALFSTGSLSALIVHFLCKSTAPLHLLLGHYLPLAVVTVAGLVLGQLILRSFSKIAR